MRDLAIAYGNSRQAKNWVNKTIRYEDLKERLKVTIRTAESAEEYAKMSKAQRDVAKDHGGFVGGALKGGRRKVDAVELRSMIALDGDRIDKAFLDDYETNASYTSCLYTTHSSTEANPRVRLVFPLLRDVTSEEFVAVSRYLAQMLGIDFFDECSYQPNQLMYWPSSPQNGVFVFKEVEKEWLDPDAILSVHPEWTDPTRLPTSSRESKANQVTQQKVQDPLEKEGTVGIFNRVFFPVTRALEIFLAGVYEPTESESRWHLIASSSIAGVEIKDEKFVYSHHAKDPAYLKLCNAFDIVRVHKFGDLDDKASFRAMCDFAMRQDEVKIVAANERLSEAEKDFAESVDDEWKKRLQRNKNGVLENNLHNIRLIMENDPYMKNIVFNQLADGMEIRGAIPWKHPARFWRDADDAQLICYIDASYGSFSQRNYDIAVTKAADDRSYHPIKEYFDGLPVWDEMPRVDTVLIDYLGAQDNAYVRAVTRKALCAAYMRIYHPGIKFDYITVLNGNQGIGKSTLIAKLGMEWFADSLTLSDMNDKTAAEKLQGYWIHEIGEMAGMRKAELEKVKAFVSRQDDKYRASFGRRVTPHPRQCIFFGTTNSENGYLRDITGNRRFWNVKVTGDGRMKPWDLGQETVDQIWAEVIVLSNAGEELFLDHTLEDYARKEQSEAMEQDDREGLVARYLDMLLPETWDTMDVHQRRDYVQDPDGLLNAKGTMRRETVSNIEIWCECFGKAKEDIKPADSYAISAIMARLPDWSRPETRRRIPIYGLQRLYKKM
ncbi:virulence-associated protein E [Selenomonas sp. FOBRC6]|uniref:virulence-associated E family protein n=1 Tax=Selenomonas sp. FOBRC6 TaxID=936572 RepID=UPI000277F06B|nr:virulence-associated E family protein [Selenomonas sp. FOBRC6]EJO21974.1 virulence-associated protein E [Selenomonas sp. FOBRC6]DAS19352.1 MAG TPA: virulence associated protein E [Caudoviricetes sp.]